MIRTDATTPEINTPPTVVRSSATPSGICPLAPRYDTFTDLVFWRMNTSSSTSTTAAITIPTQVPEIRVRAVACRDRLGRAGGLCADGGRGPDGDPPTSVA